MTVAVIFPRNFFPKPSFRALFNCPKAPELRFNPLLPKIVNPCFFSSSKRRVFY
jgi:hypothetical protein